MFSAINNNQNKGFSITFKNGLTISVQFGIGNYCTPEKSAEIAIWDNLDNWYTFAQNRNCEGWTSPEEVASWIDAVSKAKDINSIIQPK